MKIDNKISLDTLYINVSISILITNNIGVIVKVNQFLLNQFGYTEPELIGSSLDILIPPRFHDVHHEHVYKYSQNPITITTGTGTGKNIYAIRKNGVEFPVEVTLNNITTPEGDFIIIIIYDISKRRESELSLKHLNEDLENRIEERTLAMSQTVKTLAKLIAEAEAKDNELKESNSFLQNIWNYATAIIIVTDKKGIIKLFNPNAEERLGYTAEEVIGKLTPLDFFDKEDIKQKGLELANELNIEVINDFQILSAKADLGLINEYEVTLVSKDGSKFPVLMTFNKMGSLEPDSLNDGYIGICKDISILKKAEEDLKKSLEKEKELSDIRLQFLSLASHEFRTPLSVILSSAFIVSHYTKTEDNDKREKHIQRIISSVNLLKNILNDFLSISKIEEGKLQVRISDFDIKTNIKVVISELSSILKNKQKIVYRHFGDVNVSLDFGMLKQIIVNLLSNAIKFSPEDSTISINTKKTDHKLIILIKDKGFGISKEDQEHLFDRFFRASNVSFIQGTGLGLHIVNQYVNQMNGVLKFKSKLGIGTTIQIVFYQLEQPIENLKD